MTTPEKKGVSSAPVATPVSSTPATTGNAAAPKKERKAPIKYTHVVESDYKPTSTPDTMHPLDRPAITSRGGLKFPGVEFEVNPLGVVVYIPGRQTILKNPTVRGLLKQLDDLYK